MTDAICRRCNGPVAPHIVSHNHLECLEHLLKERDQNRARWDRMGAMAHCRDMTPNALATHMEKVARSHTLYEQQLEADSEMWERAAHYWWENYQDLQKRALAAEAANAQPRTCVVCDLTISIVNGEPRCSACDGGAE